jgi:WD40 repeat protein
MSWRQGILLLLIPLAFTSGLPARGQNPTAGASKAARTDLYGDPLPEGALARLGTVRLRHPGGISSLAYSPDGKMLAVFTFDHRVHRGLCWSNQSKGAIYIWDALTGKRIHRIDTRLRGQPFLAFSGDGKRLLGISQLDCALWDAVTGKELQQTHGVRSGDSAALAPDGMTVSLAGTESLRLLNMNDGKELRILEMPKYHIWNLAFSSDGATLAGSFSILNGAHGVCLWDVGTGRRLHKLPPESAGTRLAFAPGGKILATSGINGPVQLWDVGTGEKLRTLGDRDTYWFVAFTGDGKALLTVRNDGIVLWDAITGKELRRFGKERPRTYYKVVLAPGGMTLAVSAGGGVLLFDVDSGKELLGFAAPARAVEAVGFSPDGRTALTGADGLSLWDAATGKRLAALGPLSTVGAAAFAPDSKAVLAGYNQDQELRLWETATGKELRRFDGNPGEVEFVGFLGDGKSVVSMSQGIRLKPGTQVHDKGLRVWSLETGKETR